MAEGTFKEKVDTFRRQLLDDARARAGGNQAEAVRLLGLTYDQFRHYRRTLQKRP